MGRRPRRRRRTVSPATRAKISAALRGKKHPHRGVRPSAAARAHESAAHRGKHHHHKGHRMSAATRAKISRALKGRHHKRRCHCGSSSKHSLAVRRARYAQSAYVNASVKSAVKHHTKKRSKVKAKAKGKPGLYAVGSGTGATLGSLERRFSKKRGGPCHCPKRGKKKHARLRKTHSRASTHRTAKHGNRGKTSIGFTG